MLRLGSSSGQPTSGEFGIEASSSLGGSAGIVKGGEAS